MVEPAKPGMQHGQEWHADQVVPEEDEEQLCLWQGALRKAAQNGLQHKLAHVGPVLLHELGCLSWHQRCVCLGARPLHSLGCSYLKGSSVESCLKAYLE